ncbi:hypothetical protein C8Q75DRAFT_754615 [Abortiporus biennis]|nr:hypothetical protein C8Q75DRAFT_754615 [Abortiporus biennis]
MEDQLRVMSERNHFLERELRKYQNMQATTSVSDTSHLSREPDVQSNQPPLADAIGSLAIGDEGATKFFGSTSSSEYLSTLLLSDGVEGNVEKLRDPRYLDLPYEILALVYAFPFGLADCPYDKNIFLEWLPQRDRAQCLADAYFLNAAWMFSPIAQGEFQQEILNVIYQEEYPSFDFIHPHRLAIFFSVMAFGVAFKRDSGPKLQEIYHALACACVSLHPISQGVTCSTVQAFFLFVRFLNHTVRTCAEQCWLIFGICVKVAQMVCYRFTAFKPLSHASKYRHSSPSQMGLQCDGTTWNLDPNELQRRRIMFWELYTWDAWISFVMGRPPAMRLEETDCKFPWNDAHPSAPQEPGFHAWKFRYTAACLPLTLKHAFNPGSLSYEQLLELDKKIRSFYVPSHLQVGENFKWSTHAPTALQQYNAIVVKETNLLYLHRSSCAIALRENPANPEAHKYGRSVEAAKSSACRMCNAMRNIYLIYPDQLGRVWYFWSGIYSSCTLLAAIVIGSPGCQAAKDALLMLKIAYGVYEEGSSRCRPPKTLEILDKMHQRAQQAFKDFHGQSDPSSSLSRVKVEQTEELGVVGGRHGVLRHTDLRSNTASPESAQSIKSLRSSQSPPNTASLSPLPEEAVRDLAYLSSPLSAPASYDSYQMINGHGQNALASNLPIASSSTMTVPSSNATPVVSVGDIPIVPSSVPIQASSSTMQPTHYHPRHTLHQHPHQQQPMQVMQQQQTTYPYVANGNGGAVMYQQPPQYVQQQMMPTDQRYYYNYNHLEAQDSEMAQFFPSGEGAAPATQIPVPHGDYSHVNAWGEYLNHIMPPESQR